ncbi:MAG: hypothetical protein P4L74_00150 [Candidatus Doudnabacteria bacterium]|nr:hypothetical protein [Candidatus Doudnabacteria bacterium]
MPTNELIKGLIVKLPISDLDKQGLLQRLETEGEEAIKPEIQAILTKAAAQVQAKSQIDSAVKDFNQELSSIEDETSTFYSNASKLMDDIEMEEARAKLK